MGDSLNQPLGLVKVLLTGLLPKCRAGSLGIQNLSSTCYVISQSKLGNLNSHMFFSSSNDIGKHNHGGELELIDLWLLILLLLRLSRQAWLEHFPLTFDTRFVAQEGRLHVLKHAGALGSIADDFGWHTVVYITFKPFLQNQP